jgi:hypothetical protein
LFWGMVSGFSQLIGINMGLVATGSSVIPRLK